MIILDLSVGRWGDYCSCLRSSRTIPEASEPMPLLIRNADIVTADSRFHGDIYAQDETITRIASNLDAPPGTEVIDATGKLVFPGFIDPHVHIYLPFMA